MKHLKYVSARVHVPILSSLGWFIYLHLRRNPHCVAANNTNANVDEEGDNIVIDGESFNPPFEACPGSTASDGSVSSGMANASLLAAVAVVGGAVMTFFG